MTAFLSPVAGPESASPPATAAAATGEAAVRAAALDTAARLFVERGLERVSLADIAAAAGLEPRALRARYASREHVLLALQERFVRDFCQRAAQAMDACRDGDWSGRLRAWVRTGVDGYLDNVALHDVVFHDLRTHDRHAWQENPVVDQLVELLEGGIAARVWAAPDPRMTALIFFTALHSAVDRVIACGEPQDDPVQVRHRLAQTLIGYFERSVQWWSRF
ncbi:MULTISPECIES: TetR/AcrR family transcriptional regulator [unclassified Lysobacter]|uniref:TetR/AcrR family transcriptional regulator n=1 Tax=unclassified Lysobacter TaxID=2635362 RepID=UPI001BEB342C|nr:MULTISPECIES: TetR/AcrR family transcriptional regulator [unclassified Lysobacter]MBT2748110.1 TetR/AcrR family transcriptional regulator [Lysobacter sp. ISL-42]MBT2754150.1 TetR/AcrR family transcriptional regulator [Lysobacter sp. ISL-50]MBT2776024.1 TetR/AcrR family transcriptional regulator [Lysobacter sp. ISL-54]MBT2784137.1 TetR/AcrR family transcriptional regulator [Lysobacter sp. ISL-52]